MEHSIKQEFEGYKQEITISDASEEKTITITTKESIKDDNYQSQFCMSAKQLHSFIGTLLHVQAKLSK